MLLAKITKNKILNLVILVLISLFFSISFVLAQNSINKISILKSSDHSSLVFYSDKIPSYNVFVLKNPPRLVVDFDDAQLKSKISVANSTIFKSFRSAKRGGNDLRMVFDLKNDIKIIKKAALNPVKGSKDYRLLLRMQKLGANATSSDKKYSLSPLNSQIADKILKDPKKIAKKPTPKPKPVQKKVVSKPKPKKYRKKVVIIDAGHGGKDPGAIGRYYKTKEKRVTLAFAKEMKKYLDKTGKFKVYLTRNSDYFISLQGRVKKSRKLKADLFISVHADSAQSRKARGLSIYTLSETSSDKEAAKLAKKENKSDIIGGVNFSNTSGDILNTLIALSQRSTMNNSAKFAEFAIRNLQRNKIKVKQNTHRFAGFRVLTAPDVPSVLIELGYLSNKSDEKNLNSSSYRRKFSKVMTKVVFDYFQKYH